MVDAGADDRQAQGDIHRIVEMQQLQGNQPLVVVHADHRVAGPLNREVEQGVRAVRSARGDSLLLGRADRRRDQALFLVAEQALLAGVGIERQDRQARALQREAAAQVLGDDAQGLQDGARAEPFRNLPERQMGGHQADPQPFAGQHHHHPFAAAALGEQLGMPGKGQPGRTDRGLVDRSGDHARGLLRATAGHGRLHIVDHGPAAGRIGFAETQRGRRQLRAGTHPQLARAEA